MLLRTATLVFFIFVVSKNYAQKQSSKWHFGNYAALDFASGSPVSVPNSTLQSVEASASIADYSGNLLFYTNSVDVWNKNHQLMPNGSSLLGNKSTLQGAMIVRKPGSSNLYYIFTLGELGAGSLAYSLVDLTLSAGTGSVIVKNQILLSNMSEKLNATMHCNGTDVWVLAHKYNSDEYCAFLVTAAGINSTAVVSAIGSVYAPGTPSVHAASSGAMKISPTGKKVGSVINPGVNKIEIFDFDASTGQLSNGLFLDSIEYAWGCEFSPDGSKFFVSQVLTPGQHKIFQWDLCAGSPSLIKGSKQLVADPGAQQNYLLNMQLASDGRIYIATNFTSTLAAIHDPNIAGTACNFVAQDVVLTSGACLFGMPNFDNSKFRQKAAIMPFGQSNCGLLNFSITPYNYCAGVNYSVQSQSWDFGDPASGSANTSTQSSTAHLYIKNGKYAVKLLTHYQCFTDTIKDTVTIGSYPTLTVQGKTTICKGESVVLTATGAASYSWSAGQTSGSISISPNSNTVISVTGTGTNNCQTTSLHTVAVNACLGFDQYSFPGTQRQIYPNPGDGIYTITSEAGFDIAIYTILGQKVKQVRITEIVQQLDLKDLAPGSYMIQFSDRQEKGKVLFKSM